MNYLFTQLETRQEFIVYGIILIISGVYQFSPPKRKWLGYCCVPKSFFMRIWKNGISGATMMGTRYGLYCLGCCWPYFLLILFSRWILSSYQYHHGPSLDTVKSMTDVGSPVEAKVIDFNGRLNRNIAYFFKWLYGPSIEL